jgi:hypothetical protein
MVRRGHAEAYLVGDIGQVLRDAEAKETLAVKAARRRPKTVTPGKSTARH